MNNKLKTIILIITIIIIAILLTWVSYFIIVDKDVIKKANTNEVKNEITANVKEKEVESSNVQENIIEKKQENNKSEEKNDKEIVEEKTTGQTNEEKAINAVKKVWGAEEGVYFSCMGIDANGRYIVTVNDSATSAVFGWYSVDVETGEVKAQ